MARRPSTFARDLKVATAGLEPDAVAALMARTARQAVAEAVAAGEGTADYTRIVNGRVGAAEETVRPPGPILYRFHWLTEATVYALAFCESRSPVASGRYRKSWFAMVNGRPWRQGAAIPPDAEVVVTNDQPYHRKIEVGAMKLAVPPRIVESARQALFGRFGRGGNALLRVEARFVDLAGAYRLKRDHGRAGRRRGDPITYPALVITAA